MHVIDDDDNQVLFLVLEYVDGGPIMDVREASLPLFNIQQVCLS